MESDYTSLDLYVSIIPETQDLPMNRHTRGLKLV